MATTPLQAERVELDRQAVLDLLLEAQTVVEVLEALAGAGGLPTPLTDELSNQVARVAEELLGDWDDCDPEGVRRPSDWEPGARERLSDASVERSRERFRELAARVGAIDEGRATDGR